MSEQRIPTPSERHVLEAMRQGARLAEGTSKYQVAFLDDKEEVDLKTVEAVVAAGWVYQFDDLDGKRVWGLTREGLHILS